jgi:hypothetical protein
MFFVCTTGDTAHIDTARTIATLKNIDAPWLTPVWKELEYRVDVCRVTHTSNISSCQKKLFQFSCGCEQFL